LIADEPGVVLQAATNVEPDERGQFVPDSLPRMDRLIEAAKGASRLVIQHGEVEEMVVGCRSLRTETGVTGNWMTFDSI